MERLNKPSSWLILGATVLALEMREQTLSGEFKVGREHDDFLIRAAVVGTLAVTAAHLMDWLPKQVDPIDHIAEGVGKLRDFIMKRTVPDFRIP